MANVYEIVTNNIIEEMKKGIIPWKKPWTNEIYVDANGNRRPFGAYNRITRQPYHGINRLLLPLEGEYATFKQWQKLGGKIKKGEHGHMVVYYKIMSPMKDDTEEEVEIKKGFPLLRYYTVFHVSQVEGVEPVKWRKLSVQEETLNGDEVEENADKVLNDYYERENITVTEINGDRAFYRPMTDSICLPEKSQFKELSEYYSTKIHETVHSTGHTKRLNRFEPGGFGSEAYSKEELVAEIGSAILMNMLGIDTESTFKNSVAYLQSWISVLQNNPKWIVQASSKAEKAIKLITGEE